MNVVSLVKSWLPALVAAVVGLIPKAKDPTVEAVETSAETATEQAATAVADGASPATAIAEAIEAPLTAGVTALVTHYETAADALIDKYVPADLQAAAKEELATASSAAETAIGDIVKAVEAKI